MYRIVIDELSVNIEIL